MFHIDQIGQKDPNPLSAIGPLIGLGMLLWITSCHRDEPQTDIEMITQFEKEINECGNVPQDLPNEQKEQTPQYKCVTRAYERTKRWNQRHPTERASAALREKAENEEAARNFKMFGDSFPLRGMHMIPGAAAWEEQHLIQSIFKRDSISCTRRDTHEDSVKFGPMTAQDTRDCLGRISQDRQDRLAGRRTQLQRIDDLWEELFPPTEAK
jgi:hypothetical protein